MAQMTMIQAITDALRTEMKNDENVLVFGEDVGVNGGVFRATEGLQQEFGEDRVFDTPLAESGIGGLAVGLSTQGFRPPPTRSRSHSSILYQVKLHVCATVLAVAGMHQLHSVHHSVEAFIHQNFTLIA